MVITRRCNDRAQQSLIFVHGANHGGTKNEELRVFVRRISWIQNCCRETNSHVFQNR